MISLNSDVHFCFVFHKKYSLFCEKWELAKKEEKCRWSERNQPEKKKCLELRGRLLKKIQTGMFYVNERIW